MDQASRIALCIALGNKIRNLTEGQLEELLIGAESQNPWFIRDFVRKALDGLLVYLEGSSLETWAAPYDITDQRKKVGVVMAGNIPMVGFHDLLAVFVSGNYAHCKTSSKDTFLMRQVLAWMIQINSKAREFISFHDRLNHVDALIATGSDNSSRYFRYYFKDIPHIIRQNRTSIAVLDGNETEEQLMRLADDIFLYFGLGCRNVSKIFVPQGFKMEKLLDTFSSSSYQSILEHHKYANNYDYNKSIYLVNGEDHLDTGFVLFRNTEALVSPTAVVFWQEYQNQAELLLKIAQHQQKIQCVVSEVDWYESAIPFGKAQSPELADYADGVDTMEFLTGLH